MKKSSIAVRFALVGCVSLVVACFIGFGMASAWSVPGNSSFGVASQGETLRTTTSHSETESLEPVAARDTMVLTSTAKRDISQGIDALAAQEEAERLAAEEAARIEEQKRIEEAEAAKAEQQATAASSAAASLPDVDWSVGKDAFIAEWTSRIDAYLAGSPLAGQGVVFATAAWNNGVDPRWSPAISNTESSKGSVCFLPYNAWGWGHSSWSNWEDAINAHVAGLASAYGYSITYSGAMKYCPPNYDHWFKSTLSQMQSM